MCGIVCYLGHKPALPILLDGLHRLEYRGYDSAGVALLENGTLRVEKAKGKVRELEKLVYATPSTAHAGIAHTRWATHGKPSAENAHPHGDCKGEVLVIHNGIVENYQDLKAKLAASGHVFKSETDTEVLAHLIEEHLKDTHGDLEEAVLAALREVRGTFGLGVVAKGKTEQIVVARRGSPLIIGIGDGEVFAASDVSALVSYTKNVVYLQDDDVAVLTKSGYHLRNLEESKVFRAPTTVDWDISAAEKQGYAHFMLKEIHEQPEAVANAMRGRILEPEGISKLGGLDAVLERLVGMDRLIIISCGTSYYAGLLGRYVLETATDYSVEVDLASEFRYRKLNFRPKTAVLAISQSGETLDTLAAVQEAKRKGALVLGIVNVVGSNIARETHAGVYNHAGPEIGVASTKAFISQLTILYLLTLLLARRQRMDVNEGRHFLRELEAIPEKIQRILAQSDRIHEIAKKYAQYRNFLYVGRKFNYPIALEGALKLKEISYLHAEAYAAGEMKHGPIALIDPDFPSMCLVPRDSSYEKMVSNIQEIRARSGPVIAVATEGDREIGRMADDVIAVPAADELMTPLLTVVPLQLFAYYVALERGCEIDQPRNLAKSVTVE